MKPIELVQRGHEPYPITFAAMRAYTDTRNVHSPDQLWLVSHDPVYTLGLGADPEHILDAGRTPVVQTDRGGEVTFHGPGQAIVYVLIDLRRRHPTARLLAREFVHAIEQAVIDTLAAYNLRGERRTGAPGIYHAEAPLQGAKLAALGLKVRVSGCTYHGVALNVEMDLQPFAGINPCGYPGLVTTDMRHLGVTASTAAVQARLANALQHRLGAMPTTPTTIAPVHPA